MTVSVSSPIIVFDSGVGGLSILMAIRDLQLGYPLIYLADQANFPYGNKSSVWLETRLAKVSDWVSHYSPSAFVIACNTATVNSISQVRKHLQCSVVGVEPVIKPLSSYTNPLVLATQTTLKSFPDNTSILTISPKGLVQAIEAMDRDSAQDAIERLAPMIIENQVDALGLSCTHYPLVANIFQDRYKEISIIDPSRAVAKHLSSLLVVPSTLSTTIEFYTTGDPQQLATQVQYYLDITTKAGKVKI